MLPGEDALLHAVFSGAAASNELGGPEHVSSV